MESTSACLSSAYVSNLFDERDKCASPCWAAINIEFLLCESVKPAEIYHTLLVYFGKVTTSWTRVKIVTRPVDLHLNVLTLLKMSSTQLLILWLLLCRILSRLSLSCFFPLTPNIFSIFSNIFESMHMFGTRKWGMARNTGLIFSSLLLWKIFCS